MKNQFNGVGGLGVGMLVMSLSAWGHDPASLHALARYHDLASLSSVAYTSPSSAGSLRRDAGDFDRWHRFKGSAGFQPASPFRLARDQNHHASHPQASRDQGTGSSTSQPRRNYDDLTPERQKRVHDGETVMVTEEVHGKPWPKVTVFQRIESTPEEAAAVFWDVEKHKDFIPGMKFSEILYRSEKSTIDVEYVLDMPWPISDVRYIVRNVLRASKGSEPEKYNINWDLIKSGSIKSASGYVDFQRMGTGTLMIYDNFVVPNSGLAAIGREKAVVGVRNAAVALKVTTEKERAEQRELLDRQLMELRQAIAER